MGAVAEHEVDSSHPLWLLLTTGLPHGILLLLSYRQYTVLRSLLEPEERIWTAGLALALIVLSGSAMVHAVRCWVRRKPLEPLPTLVFLGAVVPLLYLFSFLFFREVWSRVEEWMFSPLDYYLLVLSLTLPSLVYGLVLAVSWRLTRAKTKSAWRTFLGAVLIPGAYYLFFQALLPVLRRGLYPQLTVHAVAVTAIVAAVVFFFLLLRGLQLLIAGRREKLARYEPIWRVVFGLVLPMAGLVFYNHGGLFFGRHWPGEIFGRFASPWYYILTSLEGIVLIVPGPGGGTGRRILSTGRLIMLPFSAYFFLVFLPFTPVALLFVIAGGFGFLILSPILLFIVHGVQVARDFRVGRRSPILALAALLVIPGAVSAGFLVQRIRLRETLDYVYAPEYGRSERAPLSAAAIGPILDGIERQKHSSRGTPILTPFYRWLVLDNMTLSDARLAQLRRLFLGTSTDRPEDRRLTVPAENGAGVGIGIHRVAARSEYDAGKRFWVSRIDLEILNRGERQNEFCTSFRLPEGAFLSRYHLDVGDRREEGLVIEKRAALWVYERVKNQRRDPGLLFHAPDGSVTLKVFPFAGGELRRTGFEIIHRDPFVLSLNGREWPLGSPAAGRPARAEEIGVESGLYYLPVEVKRRLPEVNREPYYHFVIDCSARAAPDLPRCRAAIRSFLARRPLGSPGRAKVSLANHSMQTHDWQEDWEGAAFKAEGALFLDRVLKTILFRHHVAGGLDYPVIVLVSPDLSGSVWLESLHDFSLTSPESDCYYHLDLQGTVRTCSLYSPPDLSRPIEPIGSPSGAPELGKRHPVVVWRGRNGTPVYLRRDDRASIVLSGNRASPPAESGDASSLWERGVYLRALWLYRTLYPRSEERAFRAAFKESVAANLLSPAVSFVVVEDEAQRRMLARKQALALGGRKYMEVGEEITEMAEPGLLPLSGSAILLAGLLRVIRNACRRSRSRAAGIFSRAAGPLVPFHRKCGPSGKPATGGEDPPTGRPARRSARRRPAAASPA